MKKSSTLISVVFLLCVLTACAGNKPTSTPTSDANNISTIVAATLSAIPPATIMPTTTYTPIVDEWTWHNIDLYGFKLRLPSGWTVSEVNRRLEPTGPGYPTPEHDCAEYNISNPDGTMKLFLKPECIHWESNGNECPNDTVLMSRHNDEDELIGRYYDRSKSAYIYAMVGGPVPGTNVVTACYGPNILIGNDKNTNAIYVEFQYLGTETNINQILNIVDEIILSLSKQ